jgi:hypothetical protein
MKRMRIMGLALVAVFAMTAIVASSASAAGPSFGRCVAQAGGKFLNNGCTKPSTPGKEKYEWTNVIPKPKFFSKLKEGIPTLETVKGTKITCKTEEGPGEITSPKSVGGVVATFTGCETSGLKCASAGQAEGVIVTSALEGIIGVEKVGTKTPLNDKVASELHAPVGQKVAAFVCAGLPVEVRGSVLHPVTVNKMLLTATEKFTASKGKQKPEHYAGGVPKEHILESNTNGGPFEQAGQTITALVTFEEKVEINTTQ